MAKKILAVVLAVMMAVSAMAITAFADEIPLHYNSSSYASSTARSRVQQVQFTIPIYGLYSYLTANEYVKLTLPLNWDWNVPAGTEVKWTLVYEGVSYTLPTVKVGDRGATFDVDVVFSYLAHNWDGVNVAVPQNTIGTVGAQTFVLYAEMVVSDGGWDPVGTGIFASNGLYATDVKAEVWSNNGTADKSDDTPIFGAVSYAPSWNAQLTDNSTSSALVNFDFVSGEWNTTTWSTEDAYVLTWDHNLGNRAAIMGAESAQVVVELNKPIVGRATYTLVARKGWDANTGTANVHSDWWNYSDSRQVIKEIVVDGSTDSLVFDVNVADLLDVSPTAYGTFNREFVIFENINLFNGILMDDYMRVSTAANRGGSNGSNGPLSWGPMYGGEAYAPVRYNGTQVNYARTGIAGVGIVVGYDRYVKYITTAAKSTWTLTVPNDGSTSPWGVGFTPVFPTRDDAGNVVPGWDGVNPGLATADIDALEDTDIVVITSADGYEFLFQGSDKYDGTNDYKNSENGVMTFTGAQLKAAINPAPGYSLAQIAGVDGNTANPFEVTVEVYAGDEDGNIAGTLTTADDPNATVVVTTADDADAVYEIVTADAAGATPIYNGQNVGADVMAKRAYILTSNGDDEETTVPETPTEGIDGDEDDDTMNVEDNETAAPESNPKTGIALAVVPMLVAAAAAVVSKKH